MKTTSVRAAALGALLLAASATRAQDPGTPAPELTPEVWLNLPEFEGKALAHLRGSAVLLEYWQTWCGPCRAQVPNLNKVYAQYRARGLAVVGVTNEHEDKVKAYVDAAEVEYPIAIEPGYASSKALGVKGFPSAFLIDPQGAIVWSGHPSRLTDADIEKALVGARPFGPLPAPLKPIQRHLDRQEFGKAREIAKMILGESTLPANDRTFAQSLVSGMEADASRLYAAAQASLEQQDWLPAVRAFEKLGTAYRGFEQSEAAIAKAKELRSDPKISVVIEARARLEEGTSLETERDYQKAWSVYRDVVTRFAGTAEAATAGKAVERIESADLLEYRKDCEQCRGAGAACAKHTKR